mmetsp:Transcript_8453/g.26349  ORF Transcript_8453/g.26349 Transcript_8453/m.26349 type:complete len:564 (+) Transcript_8453:122-1813(+)
MHSDFLVLLQACGTLRPLGDWLDIKIWGCACGIRIIQHLSPSVFEAKRYTARGNDSIGNGLSICMLNVPVETDLHDLLARVGCRQAWLPSLTSAHIIGEPSGQTSNVSCSVLFQFLESSAADLFATALSEILASQLIAYVESESASLSHKVSTSSGHSMTSSSQPAPLCLVRTLAVDAALWFPPRHRSVTSIRQVSRPCQLMSTGSSKFASSVGSSRLAKLTGYIVPRLSALAARAARVRELPSCVHCLDQLDCFEPQYWPYGTALPTMQHDRHCNTSGGSTVQTGSPGRTGHESCAVQYLRGNSGRCCTSCGDSDALWCCLVCGHIGCGRYSNEHAKTHFNLSGHSLSIEVATRRIWDYAQDAYVHRLRTWSSMFHVGWCRSTLYQYRSDKTSAKGPLGMLGTHRDRQSAMQTKLAELAMHYEGILETQLATQSRHYEQLAAGIEAARLAVPVYSDKLDGDHADIAALHALCAWKHAQIRVATRDYSSLALSTDAARAAVAALQAKTQNFMLTTCPNRLNDLQSMKHDLRMFLSTRMSLVDVGTRHVRSKTKECTAHLLRGA